MAGTPASIAAVVTQCAALGDDVAFHAQLLKTGDPATELASTSGIFLSGGSLDAAAAAKFVLQRLQMRARSLRPTVFSMTPSLLFLAWPRVKHSLAVS